VEGRERAGSRVGAGLPARMGEAASGAGDASPPVPVLPARFQGVDALAEGGMGRLYSAFDRTSRKRVAIKTPRTNIQIEIASLRQEAAVLARVRGPGVVSLVASGSAKGVPWLATELLEGRTLRDEIGALWGATARSGGSRSRRSRDELPTLPGRPIAGAIPARGRRRPRRRPPVAGGQLPRVAAIVEELAIGLDRVHALGFVHRDLKPENVFLPEGRAATLLDFGLACGAGEGTSPFGHDLCVGTMSYAAPEQILGAPVDARTDVYALGCLLYELLTGLRPFDGDSPQEVAGRQLRCEVRPPSTLVADVPWQLEELLGTMLAKRPAERPATAGLAARRLAVIVRRSGDGGEQAQEALGA
jgi:serine/threonine protein kinase